MIFRYRKFELPISEISEWSDLPKISEIGISDIGKSFWFSDIGKSVDLLISEIRISDIVNSARFSDIGKSTDLPISDFDFPISVIENGFPISVNQLIYRYRKFNFPILEIRFD